MSKPRNVYTADQVLEKVGQIALTGNGQDLEEIKELTEQIQKRVSELINLRIKLNEIAKKYGLD